MKIKKIPEPALLNLPANLLKVVTNAKLTLAIINSYRVPSYMAVVSPATA